MVNIQKSESKTSLKVSLKQGRWRCEVENIKKKNKNFNISRNKNKFKADDGTFRHDLKRWQHIYGSYQKSKNRSVCCFQKGARKTLQRMRE